MIAPSNAEFIQNVPFHQLFLSPDNVRKDDSDLAIEELADLIAAEGVLQNLAGYAETTGKGKHKKSRIGVVAGGRRFRALTLLVEQRRIEPDYVVPCLVTSRERAVAISLTENSGRKDLHPADEFVAFRDLVNQGKTVDEVAAAFRVSSVVVQRRLRLANVHPDFLDLFRKGAIKITHMMALAVTDDTVRQKAAWLALPESRRSPEALREVLTETEVAASRPVAKYVGLDAYQAAGGPVRTDLFSEDEDAVFLVDAALLQQLAQQKLNAAAEALKPDIGAWIEVSPRLDFADLADYGRVKSTWREPTPEEQESITQVCAEIEALEAQLYDADEDDEYEEDDEDLDSGNDIEGHDEAVEEGGEAVGVGDQDNLNSAECRKLEERLEMLREEEETLRQARRVPDPAQAAVAGTLLSIDRNGELKVQRGLLKPADAKRFMDEETRSTRVSRQKTPGALPSSLVLRLSAHRTQALQATLANNTKVALAALCQRFVLAAFFDAHSESATALRLAIGEPNLKAYADDLQGSKAFAALQARREEWRAKIPEDACEVLPWLLDQSDSTIAELLAFCTSMSLDGIQAQVGATRADELARAVNLDMSDWWVPTADGYLRRIKKGQILEIVKDVVSPEKAARLEKMKKAEMAKAAEAALAGTRWLPSYYKQDTAA